MHAHTHTYTHSGDDDELYNVTISANKTNCHHHEKYSESEVQSIDNGVDEGVLSTAMYPENAQQHCVEEELKNPLKPQGAYAVNPSQVLQGDREPVSQ